MRRRPSDRTMTSALRCALVLMMALCHAACGDDAGGGGAPADNTQTPDAGLPDSGDESDGGDVVASVEHCGLDFPEGACPQGQTCLDGACVSLGLVCSPAQPDGLCTHGGRCVNGGCWGADQYCSSQTPVGVCPEGQFCNQGVCTTRNGCGSEDPHGACGPGETCFEAACRPVTDFCGADNPSGACDQGLICLEASCVPEDFLCGAEQRAGRCPRGETCSGGECLAIDEACSLANPGGACGGGFDCLEGACRDPAELCSPTNPFGFCAEGLSCVDGQCVEQNQTCSPQVPDGLCPDGMVCSAGHCHGQVACDNTFAFGDCATGETCLCGAGEQAPVSCSAGYAPDDATSEQRRAIERTNELRNSIGLWSITEHPRINEAAQAHADYLVNESNEGHNQTNTASPYFTGERFWERMEAADYNGSAFSEVIAYIGDAERAVDELVATVYHREPFFSPHALELGYGGAVGPRGAADVINFGRAQALCRTPTLVVYPPHGAVDVPTSWDGLENPTPPAPSNGYPSGPIISVHGSEALTIDEHHITLGDSELPHTHLTAENDPNGSVGQEHYFLYTDAPLLPATTYNVLVTGRHAGKSFRLQWSFTTSQ